MTKTDINSNINEVVLKSLEAVLEGAVGMDDDAQVFEHSDITFAELSEAYEMVLHGKYELIKK